MIERGQPFRRPDGTPALSLRECKTVVSGHVHTGIVEFAFAGLSAIVMIHLLRFTAAKMIASPSLSGFGKALGGIVSF